MRLGESKQEVISIILLDTLITKLNELYFGVGRDDLLRFVIWWSTFKSTLSDLNHIEPLTMGKYHYSAKAAPSKIHCRILGKYAFENVDPDKNVIDSERLCGHCMSMGTIHIWIYTIIIRSLFICFMLK